MTHTRKEVFQSKLLQKLYRALPKLDEEIGPPLNVDILCNKSTKGKTSQQVPATGDAAPTQSAVDSGKRLYTVLPPPADWKADCVQSFTPTEIRSINAAEDPAEGGVHNNSEELDQEEEAEKLRRRWKRRRKFTLREDGAASVIESSKCQNQAEGGERISRNKRRKMKKKRHKEKLFAMGVLPRAAALEFTYQRNEEKRAAEVSNFLKATMEIYKSDSSLHIGELPLHSEEVYNLVSNVSSREKSSAVLKQLHSLIGFVQRKETDGLSKSLEELQESSSMSAEETTAVVSLFRYWITDILPMRGNCFAQH
ncbi:glutamate-rich protein 1 isoform X2 [Thalassophryne amazonica]|uniref:glutamate-rich protein 1 isoform X2 n=1 Tax=Thalassophryne amazonica TaxID=390379 RepID=UPI00147111D4|nr:glutamate-rich protein 1 isoform X2 [Thalassophryne amazonica]